MECIGNMNLLFEEQVVIVRVSLGVLLEAFVLCENVVSPKESQIIVGISKVKSVR